MAIERRSQQEIFKIPELRNFFVIKQTYEEDDQSTLEKIFSFIFLIKHKFENFNSENLDYSNIIHVSLAEYDGEIIILAGLNFLLEDLYYFNELFRIWNYQRNNIQYENIPLITTYNIHNIISTYFGNIRAFFYKNNEEEKLLLQCQKKIKNILENNFHEIINGVQDQWNHQNQIQQNYSSFQQGGFKLENCSKYLLKDQFDHCFIRVCPLSGQDHIFSERKKLISRIFQDLEELWSCDSILQESYGVVQKDQVLIFCFQFKKNPFMEKQEQQQPIKDQKELTFVKIIGEFLNLMSDNYLSFSNIASSNNYNKNNNYQPEEKVKHSSKNKSRSITPKKTISHLEKQAILNSIDTKTVKSTINQAFKWYQQDKYDEDQLKSAGTKIKSDLKSGIVQNSNYNTQQKQEFQQNSELFKHNQHVLQSIQKAQQNNNNQTPLKQFNRNVSPDNYLNFQQKNLSQSPTPMQKSVSQTSSKKNNHYDKTLQQQYQSPSILAPPDISAINPDFNNMINLDENHQNLNNDISINTTQLINNSTFYDHRQQYLNKNQQQQISQQSLDFLKNNNSFLNGNSQNLIKQHISSQIDDSHYVRQLAIFLNKINLNLENIETEQINKIFLKKSQIFDILKQIETLKNNLNRKILPNLYLKFREFLNITLKFENYLLPKKLIMKSDHDKNLLQFSQTLIENLMLDLNKFSDLILKEPTLTHQQLLLDMSIFYIFNSYNSPKQFGLKFIKYFVEKDLLQSYKNYRAYIQNSNLNNYSSAKSYNSAIGTSSDQNDHNSILFQALQRYFSLDIFTQFFELVNENYSRILNFKDYEKDEFQVKIIEMIFSHNIVFHIPYEMLSILYMIIRMLENLNIIQKSLTQQIIQDNFAPYGYIAYLLLTLFYQPYLDTKLQNNFTQTPLNHDKMDIKYIKFKRGIQALLENFSHFMQNPQIHECLKNYIQEIKDSYEKKYKDQEEHILDQNTINDSINYNSSIEQNQSIFLQNNLIIEPCHLSILLQSVRNFYQQRQVVQDYQDQIFNEYFQQNQQILDKQLKQLLYNPNFIILKIESSQNIEKRLEIYNSQLFRNIQVLDININQQQIQNYLNENSDYNNHLMSQNNLLSSTNNFKQSSLYHAFNQYIIENDIFSNMQNLINYLEFVIGIARQIISGNTIKNDQVSKQFRQKVIEITQNESILTLYQQISLLIQQDNQILIDGIKNLSNKYRKYETTLNNMNNSTDISNSYQQ